MFDFDNDGDFDLDDIIEADVQYGAFDDEKPIVKNTRKTDEQKTSSMNKKGKVSNRLNWDKVTPKNQKTFSEMNWGEKLIVILIIAFIIGIAFLILSKLPTILYIAFKVVEFFFALVLIAIIFIIIGFIAKLV